MADKLPGDMTATEIFAQQAYGITPQASPSMGERYDRFREQVRNRVAEGAGLIKPLDNKYKEFRSSHPFLDAIPDAAAAYSGAMMGPIGMAASALAPSTRIGTRNPTSFERGPGQPERAAAGAPEEASTSARGVNISSLPDPSGPSLYQRSAVSGVEGGSEFGTDRRIQNAQLNELADKAGYQEKKGEEAAAHLGYLDEEAGYFQRIAGQKKIQADAEMRAAETTQKEQEEQETKIQQANDELSELGVDPGRHFKNRDMGFWLTMTIGAVAGGMLQAMNNLGSNPFIDSLRETVRNDINAQERNIDQKGKKLKGLETAYERMRARGADRITATIRQYDKTLESVETEIKGKLAKARVPEVKANLEAALQSIQIERDAQATKMEEYWKSVRDQRMAAARSAASAAYERSLRFAHLKLEERKLDQADRHLDIEAQRGGREGAAKQAKDQNELFVPTGKDPDTGMVTGYMAASDVEGRTARKKVEANNKLVALAQQAQQHRSNLEKFRASSL